MHCQNKSTQYKFKHSSFHPSKFIGSPKLPGVPLGVARPEGACQFKCLRNAMAERFFYPADLLPYFPRLAPLRAYNRQVNLESRILTATRCCKHVRLQPSFCLSLVVVNLRQRSVAICSMSTLSCVAARLELGDPTHAHYPDCTLKH